MRHTWRALVLLTAGAAVFGPAQGAEPAPQIAAQAVLEDHYPALRASFVNGVVGLPNLTYESLVGFRPLTLDLYVPEGGQPRAPLPLVIYIHGGGWMGGHSRQSGAFVDFPDVLASIAARGYVVASVNYRLSGEAPFPAAEQDVKAAIHWLRAHAASYGIDPARALVWGGSAGGHLAGLTAVSCGVAAFEPQRIGEPGSGNAEAPTNTSNCVQGAVTWYGVFDFSKLAAATSSQPNPVRKFLCGPGACPPGLISRASPVTYVSASTPPMLLIAGTIDHTVPPDQSRQMYALLRENHVKVRLMMIPGVGHSFVGPTLASTRGASLKALDATIAFIDATIGPESK